MSQLQMKSMETKGPTSDLPMQVIGEFIPFVDSPEVSSLLQGRNEESEEEGEKEGKRKSSGKYVFIWTGSFQKNATGRPYT